LLGGRLLRKHLFATLAIILLLCPTWAQQPTGIAPGREKITNTLLKDYLYFIASDELEGRNTPSKGLNVAAKFIAMNLSRWGLKPGGDNGSFWQKMTLVRKKLDLKNSYITLNNQRYKHGEDFLYAQGEEVDFTAPVVFVGHGWVIKSKQIDPYQGLNVKDKYVLYFGGALPGGMKFNELEGKEGEDWISPEDYARKNGARGLLAVANLQALANWERIRQFRENVGSGPFRVEKLTNPEETKLPQVVLSPKLFSDLYNGESGDPNRIFSQPDISRGHDLSPVKKLQLVLNLNVERAETQNIVGILEGQDPQLKQEYVALGAHYDHVGISPTIEGDNLFNGADDDGSGTVALLAMAEALAQEKARPRRSYVFIWHAGEEKGLLGSRYFTRFPTVPLDKIVTQLNIDMIGRSRLNNDPKNPELTGPNEIYIIGPKLMSTELEQLSETVNQANLQMQFNYKFDTLEDSNRYFFRSDHFNYAVQGIPVIFYFNGTHEDYHRPSDTPDKIDYDKLSKVARTVYQMAWELANRDKRPTVDKKIDVSLDH
jgi:hypothetical protein